MQLLDYLKSLSPEARTAFAEKCGTSVDYLFQLGYGKRQPKAELAIAIERESGRQVRCETLLPNADWAYVRGAAGVAAVGAG